MKDDSQIGVALEAGHPVYFVIFYPDPMPGQTLADVTDAEAEFIRIVAERHRASPKPVIVGNCQGGWAVMMLAAARPDIAGPLVINGAPMSYWSGNDGETDATPASSAHGGAVRERLGGGKFDGAYLVRTSSTEPREHLLGEVVPPVANIDEEPSASSSSSAGGAGSTMNEERSAGSPTTPSSATSSGGRPARSGRYFDQVDQAADHRVRVDGRQHHAAQQAFN
jgi:pimeloyl-ACP methyl ester carboxylesterase